MGGDHPPAGSAEWQRTSVLDDALVRTSDRVEWNQESSAMHSNGANPRDGLAGRSDLLSILFPTIAVCAPASDSACIHTMLSLGFKNGVSPSMYVETLDLHHPGSRFGIGLSRTRPAEGIDNPKIIGVGL